MKKPNLSIDQAQIKAFFLHHGEKIGFAVFVFVAVYFAYKALTIETYQKTPDDLRQVTQRATNTINGSQWDKKLAGVEVIDYSVEARKISDPIDAPTKWATFSRPVFDVRAKRGEPPYYSVEAIEVSAGFGAFRVRRADEAGRRSGGGGLGSSRRDRDRVARRNDRGSRTNRSNNKNDDEDNAPTASPANQTKGYRWAEIVALVPLEKQQKAYDEAFARSVLPKPESDEPQYVGYLVERAEVTDENNTDQLKWVRVGAGRDGEHFTYPKEWDQRGTELVDHRYVLKELVYPLGPLVGREWGSEVTHSQLPLPDDSPNAPRSRLDDRLAEKDPTDDNRPLDIEIDPDREEDEDRPLEEDDPGVRLFRFFDFSVAPGKRYRYRVRLALVNPNKDIAPQYLERPELAEKELRLTDWSEPSPVVVVPRDDNLLIGPAIAASGRNESKLKVVFEHFVAETGAIARHEGEVVRGQTANVRFEDVQVSNGLQNDPEILPELTFQTDYLVVDLVGGDASPKQRRLKRPSEALFFSPDGHLEVRTQKKDKPLYEAALAALSEEESSSGPASDNRPFDDEPFGSARSRGSRGGGLGSSRLKNDANNRNNRRSPRRRSR